MPMVKCHAYGSIIHAGPSRIMYEFFRFSRVSTNFSYSSKVDLIHVHSLGFKTANFGTQPHLECSGVLRRTLTLYVFSPRAT